MENNAVPLFTFQYDSLVQDVYNLLPQEGSRSRAGVLGSLIRRVDKLALEIQTFLPGNPGLGATLEKANHLSQSLLRIQEREAQFARELEEEFRFEPVPQPSLWERIVETFKILTVL